mgnify:FL=1
MKQFFGKKSRSALAMVLIVSLCLHVVAIVIFGTIKFVSDALREEQTFEAAAIEQPPQQKPEYVVNLQQRNKSTPPPRPPAIVVNNPSELDIPALDIDVNVDSSSVYGRGGGGFGGGLSGVREMALEMEFFGNKVSGKLGVVFDISPSTHDHILAVVDELETNFPAAPIVCVVLAGFHDSDYKTFSFRRALDDHQAFASQLGDAELAERIKAALRRRRPVYAAVGERMGNRGDSDSNLAAGVDVLMRKESCQEIYIFSDFVDGSDETVMKDLAKELSEKNIKLNALVLGDGKRAPEYLENMCRRTGGRRQFFKP